MRKIEGFDGILYIKLGVFWIKEFKFRVKEIDSGCVRPDQF